MEISDQVFIDGVTHHAFSYKKNNNKNTKLFCCHFSTKVDRMESGGIRHIIYTYYLYLNKKPAALGNYLFI